MKRSSIFYSLLILFVWGLASCATEENIVEANMPPPPPPAPEVVEEVEQVEGVEEITALVQEEIPERVVGAFRSVKGVMDPLSCYCGNGGYVESPAGRVVAVCFEDNVDIASRDYIEVTGVMTTRTIESNGACPAGTKSYMVVESYKLNP